MTETVQVNNILFSQLGITDFHRFNHSSIQIVFTPLTLIMFSRYITLVKHTNKLSLHFSLALWKKKDNSIFLIEIIAK